MTLKAWCVLAKLLGYRIEIDPLGYFAWNGREIDGFWSDDRCYIRGLDSKLIRVHGYPDYKRPEDR